MAEKGIEIDTVQVDLMKGEQLTEEFREINPLGQVPVLELDDGTRITEVMAICRYLEEIYPDNSLFGRDPVERAKVESIKQALRDGNYPLNPRRIAESFVSLERMVQG